LCKFTELRQWQHAKSHLKPWLEPSCHPCKKKRSCVTVSSDNVYRHFKIHLTALRGLICNTHAHARNNVCCAATQSCERILDSTETVTGWSWKLGRIKLLKQRAWIIHR
jgi:hypothetical protein